MSVVPSSRWKRLMWFMIGLWLRTTTPCAWSRRIAAIVLGLSSSRGVEKWAIHDACTPFACISSNSPRTCW